MKTLLIRGCDIDSTAFSDLAKSLGGIPLNTIYAGNNKIQDGIKSLPVKTMTDLCFIDFANNELKFSTVFDFLKTTEGHEKLRAIDMKNNTDIFADDDEGTPTAKRDQIEKWKMETKSLLAIFGL